MSGRRAKAKRRAQDAQPPHLANARHTREAAERVLAVDFSDIPVTRVTQFAIGWLRAVFEQSRVLATLTEAGLAHAAAPNRRSFAELVVRLQWLDDTPQEKRAGMLDAMLEHEQELTAKAFKALDTMGLSVEVDLSGVENLVLEAADGVLKDQARQFLSAVKATETPNAGLYLAWREETQYTHASGAHAAAYAPQQGQTVGTGTPPVAGGDLVGHRHATTLVIFVFTSLLMTEGLLQEVAARPAFAYFDAK